MASDPAEFWRRRHDLTPSGEVDAGTDRDDYQLVLLVDITDPDVLSECERVTRNLDRFECFDASPPSVQHLTVKMFEVTAEPSTSQLADQPSAVRRIDRVVSNVASVCNPFDVTPTQLNLFPDTVYGEVADDGRLAGLNRAICDHAGVTVLDRDTDGFIPHLTFGYFGGDSEYEALVESIEADRVLRFPTVPVEQLTLVAYEVGARPPTYTHLETYDL